MEPDRSRSTDTPSAGTAPALPIRHPQAGRAEQSAPQQLAACPLPQASASGTARAPQASAARQRAGLAAWTASADQRRTSPPNPQQSQRSHFLPSHAPRGRCPKPSCRAHLEGARHTAGTAHGRPRPPRFCRTSQGPTAHARAAVGGRPHRASIPGKANARRERPTTSRPGVRRSCDLPGRKLWPPMCAGKCERTAVFVPAIPTPQEGPAVLATELRCQATGTRWAATVTPFEAIERLRGVHRGSRQPGHSPQTARAAWPECSQERTERRDRLLFPTVPVSPFCPRLCPRLPSRPSHRPQTRMAIGIAPDQHTTRQALSPRPRQACTRAAQHRAPLLHLCSPWGTLSPPTQREEKPARAPPRAQQKGACWPLRWMATAAAVRRRGRAWAPPRRPATGGPGSQPRFASWCGACPPTACGCRPGPGHRARCGQAGLL